MSIMKNPLLVMLIALLSVTVVAAQTDNTCPALLEAAIEAANANCDGLGRNEACYGYKNISAEFTDANSAALFTQPTDRVPVESLRSLASLPADTNSNEVGVAMMKIQAMLPNTLPGQNVVFVLIGDVQLESTVDPNAAASPADPVDVALVNDTILRSGPAETYNQIATATSGTILSADGLSDDGEWVRLLVDAYPVWASMSAFIPTADLLSLPPVSGDNYGPMQAFTLSSGLGTPQCEDVPNSVMIQAPEATEVTLNINGADVTIGSTVMVELTSEDDLEVVVLDGSAKLNNEQVILSGFRAWMPIDPETGQQSGRWEPTQAMEDDRILRAAAFERIAPERLNYTFERPDRETINTLVQGGAIEIQNNFNQLPPELQREVIPFEAKLATGLSTLNRPDIVAHGTVNIGDGSLREALRDGSLNSTDLREALESGNMRDAFEDGPLRDALNDSALRDSLDGRTVREALEDGTLREVLGEDGLRTALEDGTLRRIMAQDALNAALADGTMREVMGNEAFEQALRDGTLREMMGDGALRDTLADGTLREALGDEALRDTLADGALRERLDDGTVREALGQLELQRPTQNNAPPLNNGEVNILPVPDGNRTVVQPPPPVDGSVPPITTNPVDGSVPPVTTDPVDGSAPPSSDTGGGGNAIDGSAPPPPSTGG